MRSPSPGAHEVSSTGAGSRPHRVGVPVHLERRQATLRCGAGGVLVAGCPWRRGSTVGSAIPPSPGRPRVTCIQGGWGWGTCPLPGCPPPRRGWRHEPQGIVVFLCQISAEGP